MLSDSHEVSLPNFLRNPVLAHSLPYCSSLLATTSYASSILIPRSRSAVSSPISRVSFSLAVAPNPRTYRDLSGRSRTRNHLPHSGHRTPLCIDTDDLDVSITYPHLGQDVRVASAVGVLSNVAGVLSNTAVVLSGGVVLELVLDRRAVRAIVLDRRVVRELVLDRREGIRVLLARLLVLSMVYSYWWNVPGGPRRTIGALAPSYPY